MIAFAACPLRAGCIINIASFLLFLLHLRLVFLAHLQIRLQIGSSLDRCGAELLIDGIVGLIQLLGSLFPFIREE